MVSYSTFPHPPLHHQHAMHASEVQKHLKKGESGVKTAPGEPCQMAHTAGRFIYEVKHSLVGPNAPTCSRPHATHAPMLPRTQAPHALHAPHVPMQKSPEEAYRQYDLLVQRHTERLRNLTTDIAVSGGRSAGTARQFTLYCKSFFSGLFEGSELNAH